MSPQSAVNKRLRNLFRKLLRNNGRLQASTRPRPSCSDPSFDLEKLEDRTLLTGVITIVNGELTYTAAPTEANNVSVSFDAGSGNYTITESPGNIILADSAIVAGWSIQLLTGSVSGPSSSVNSMVFNMGDGNDTVTLHSLDNDPVTINGQDGDDTFNIGDGGTPNGIAVAVSVSGALGNDVVVVHALAEGGTLTGTGGDGADQFLISRVNGGAISLNGNLGDDTFTVQRVEPNSEVTLNGDENNDTFNIGSALIESPVTFNGGDGDSDIYVIGHVTGSLDNIQAQINIDGGPGLFDGMRVLDHADPDAVNYDLSNTTVSRTGAANIVHTGISNILLEASLGDNLVRSIGTSGLMPMPTLDLDGNTGFDTLLIDNISINGTGGIGESFFAIRFDVADIRDSQFNDGQTDITGVSLSQIGLLTMTDVQASRNGQFGIGLGDITSATLTNVTANGNVNRAGLSGNVIGTLRVEGGSYSNNGQHGINLNTIGPVTILNATVDGNSLEGLRLNDAGTVVIQSSSFNSNDREGAEITAVGDVTIVGSTFNSNRRDIVEPLSEGEGLHVSNAGHVLLTSVTANSNIIGLQVNPTGGSVLSFTDQSGVYNSNALGGMFIQSVLGDAGLTSTTANNNGQGAPAPEANGLDITSVLGNILITDSTFALNTQHGIYIPSNPGDVFITDTAANDNNRNGGTVNNVDKGVADSYGLGNGLQVDSLGGSLFILGGNFSDSDISNSVNKQTNGIAIQSISGLLDIRGTTAMPLHVDNNAHHGLLVVQGAANAVITGTDSPLNVTFNNNGYFDDLNDNDPPPPLPTPPDDPGFTNDTYRGNGLSLGDTAYGGMVVAQIFTGTVEMSFLTLNGNTRRGFEVNNITNAGMTGRLILSDLVVQGNEYSLQGDVAATGADPAANRGGRIVNVDFLNFIPTTLPDNTTDTVRFYKEADLDSGGTPYDLLQHNRAGSDQQPFSYATVDDLLVEGRGGNDVFLVDATYSGRTTVQAGEGNDRFEIDNANLSGQVNLLGENGGDLFNINFTLNATIPPNLFFSGGDNNLAAPFGERDALYLNDLTPMGLTLNLGFEYLTGDQVLITGLGADLTTSEFETLGLRGDSMNNDSVTVVGAMGDDDVIAVAPITANRALVFNGGDIFEGFQDDPLGVPGVSSLNTVRPDLDLSGIDQDDGLMIEDADDANTRLVVYGASESALSDGNTFDPFGFGSGVILPGFGVGNAYDFVTMLDGALETERFVQITRGGTPQVRVNFDRADVAQSNPRSPGVIVNGGDEAGVDGLGLADRFFVTPSFNFVFKVNGGNPVMTDTAAPFGEADEVGDFIDIAELSTVVNIATDAFGAISVDFANPGDNQPNGTLVDSLADFGVSFSGIERIDPFHAVAVNLLGDNNDPTISQDDYFEVIGTDVDPKRTDAVPVPMDADGANELRVRLTGTGTAPTLADLPLRFFDTADFYVFGFDGFDTLDLTPYAANSAPFGWNLDAFFDGGDFPDPNDLLIFNSVANVSEDIVVRPANPQAGQLFSTRAVQNNEILTLNYLNTAGLLFRGNNVALPETDSLFLRGTDGVTSGTSGHDRVEIDYDAAGTLADPFMQFSDIPTGNLLYRVLSITGFDVVDLDLLAGNDVLTMARTASGVNPLVASVNFGPIKGSNGNDRLDASGVTDAGFPVTLSGGLGDDTLLGGASDDRLEGDTGNDVLAGNRGVDTVLGGNDNDTIQHTVGDGNDSISAGSGANVLQLFGTSGDDVITLSKDVSNNLVVTTNAAVPDNLVVSLIQTVQVFPLAGADNVNIGDLSGTGITLVSVDMIAPDGAVDFVQVEGTSGPDNIVVSDSSGLALVLGISVPVEIRNALAAEDRLRVLARDGNDTVTASGLGNSIGLVFDGGGGSDTLTGGLGDDTLIGGSGNDLLSGLSGDDSLDGGLGDDTFVVSTGNDTVIGGSAGLGQDVLRYTGDVAGNTMTMNQTGPVIAVGGFVTGTVNVPLTDLTLVEVLGLDGSDTITLSNLAFRTSVDGGAGSDSVTVSGTFASATLVGGAGDDTLTSAEGDDSLDGGADNDLLTGGLGVDTLQGGTGNDTIVHTSGSGNDLIDGGAGSNLLRMIGGVGIDDNFILDAGSLRVRNNDGTDLTAQNIQRVSLETRSGADAVFINDLTGSGVTTIDIDLGGDLAADVVHVHGGLAGEAISITATPTVVTLTGLPAGTINIQGSSPVTDVLTVFGNGGNDTINAALGVSSVIGLVLDGGEDNDLLSGDGTLLGGNGDDTLTGGSGNNLLVGGDGNDSVDGGAGDDTILAGEGDDTLQGGSGFDLYQVLGDSNVNTLFVVETLPSLFIINGAGTGRVLGGIDRLDVLGLGAGDTMTLAINSLPFLADGGDGNDNINASASTAPGTLLGGAGADTLLGGAGNELIDGGSGGDSITGGPGLDTILGGSGDDTIVHAVGDAIDALPGTLPDESIDGGTGLNTLRLIGTPAADAFTFASNGATRFLATTPLETLSGANIQNISLTSGGGTDTITVGDLALAGITGVNLDLGADGVTDTVNLQGRSTQDAVAVTVALGVVNVSGLPSTVNIFNAQTSDLLNILGNAGNDTLTATGTDGVIGVVLNGGTGNDQLSGDGTLLGGDGADTLLGSAANNLLDGGAGNDTISGGDGNDTIISSPGLDLLVGGAGHDVLRVSGDALANTITLVESATTAGLITINGSEQVNIPLLDLEAIEVLGLGGNDNISANLRSISFLLDGGEGNDTVSASQSTLGGTLLGGAGNDLLTGGLGNDLLQGGAGDNTLAGGVGTDTLEGGSGNTTFSHTVGDGTDLVLPGSGTNTLRAMGTSGGDSFTLSASGASLVVVNQLGEAFVSQEIDAVQVATGAGSDLVTVNDLAGTAVAGVEIDLGSDTDADTVVVNGLATADNITVTQSSPAVVTGVFAPITVVGSDVTRDVLRVNGLGGNDSLTAAGTGSAIGLVYDGGAGDDVLTGGIGNDTLLGDAGNDLLRGMGGSDSLLGGSGLDTLDGGTGNDVLDGGSEDDEFINSPGSDLIIGGAGFDLLRVFGTAGPDTIEYVQPTANSLDITINGTRQIHSLAVGELERTTIEAGAGGDVISVTIQDGLSALPVDVPMVMVDGGSGNDTLTIVDEGPLDLVTINLNPDLVSGSVIVSPGDPEPFVTSFLSIEDLDADARSIILNNDPFEDNDSIGQAHFVDIRTTPSVSAAVDLVPFGRDEDWFRVTPDRGGNLVVNLLFGENPGLPNNGQLMVEIFDSNGQEITPAIFQEDAGGQLIVIPAIRDEDYFIRVTGEETGGVQGVNNYTLTFANNAVAGVGFGLFSPFVGSIPAGQLPSGVTAGDVNNDGNVDLVAVNPKGGTVSVALGNGNGTFQPAVQYAVGGRNPVAVALGDADGDGDVDILTANSKSGNVSILLNNGVGQFSLLGATPTVGKSPVGIISADFNGDGSTDFVTVNSKGNSVSVLFGGLGIGFAPAVNYDIGGRKPTAIAVADVNGDGRLDIVTSNSGSSTVSVLVGRAAGVFDPLLVFNTGAKPGRLFLGDVNNDGALDIVTSSTTGRAFSVLLNNNNAPLLPLFNTFFDVNFFAGRDRGIVVALDDLNLDGNLDVIVASSKGGLLQAALGTGNSTFGNPIPIFQGEAKSKPPVSLVLADLNNDGVVDLAFTNGNKQGTVLTLRKVLV